MASSLRAKLNAMKAAQYAPKPEARPGGVMHRLSRVPVDAAIYDLKPVGLRRMGWTGGPFDVTKCLFIDTETTGLSGGAGTVAFLVGAGYVDGDGFVVEQFLMREYADEPEMIDRLAGLMDQFDCVCTFNGKKFDMPLLEARFIMCRMRQRWREMDNLDLLHPARRAWKLRIGSCRLCRIEAEILGMPRRDDLPGSEVPGRYFEYLKTGDEGLLEDIIEQRRAGEAHRPAGPVQHGPEPRATGGVEARAGALPHHGAAPAPGHAGGADRRAHRGHGQLAAVPHPAALGGL